MCASLPVFTVFIILGPAHRNQYQTPETELSEITRGSVQIKSGRAYWEQGHCNSSRLKVGRCPVFAVVVVLAACHPLFGSALVCRCQDNCDHHSQVRKWLCIWNERERERGTLAFAKGERARRPKSTKKTKKGTSQRCWDEPGQPCADGVPFRVWWLQVRPSMPWQR